MERDTPIEFLSPILPREMPYIRDALPSMNLGEEDNFFQAALLKNTPFVGDGLNEYTTLDIHQQLQ